MPITPIRGYDGTVNQGAVPTALVAITDWDAEIDLDVQVIGPYLNDAGTLYKVRGGQNLKGKAKGNVPSGKDTNQTALITALTGGTDINVVLKQGVGGTGYTVTCATMLINNVKFGQDSKNGATVEFAFESNGTFAVT